MEQDTQIIREAIRGRWNVPQRARERSVQRLEEIINKPDVADKDLIAAVRTLGDLDKIDLKEAEIRQNMDLKSLTTAELIAKLSILFGETELTRQLRAKLLPPSPGQTPTLP
jgi:hypothetical protein